MNTVRISLALAFLVIVGCETTGDPRSGGLYGWNEDKAKQRQQQLKENVERLARLQEQAKQGNLVINGELNQVVTENAKLEVALAALNKQRHTIKMLLDEYVKKEQLNQKHIEDLYSKYPLLMNEGSNWNHHVEQSGSEAERQLLLDEYSIQLRKLKNEILLLL